MYLVVDPSADPATRMCYTLRKNLQEGSGGESKMAERLKEISKMLKSLMTRVSLLSLRVRKDMVDWADCLRDHQGDAWHKQRLTSLGTALAGLIVDADLTKAQLPDRILLQETQSTFVTNRPPYAVAEPRPGESENRR